MKVQEIKIKYSGSETRETTARLLTGMDFNFKSSALTMEPDILLKHAFDDTLESESSYES